MSPADPALHPLVEGLVAFLVVAGAAFALLGSLGLARFPDFYMRLHGPSKATTLGIGCILVGAFVLFAARGTVSFHEVLVTAFVALTTPVSAHLLARAARHRRLRDWRATDRGFPGDGPGDGTADGASDDRPREGPRGSEARNDGGRPAGDAPLQ
jgi:multicomponent K+:H+ antiporter subunit G